MSDHEEMNAAEHQQLQNSGPYWCCDCGFKCEGREMPFIAATRDNPEEGGYIESECCGAQVDDNPVYKCPSCDEEHESKKESLECTNCRLCRLELTLDRLTDSDGFLDSDSVPLHIQTTFRMLKKYLEEEIKNFKRKELT